MTHLLTEEPDHWEVGVPNQVITRCCIDYGFVIQSLGSYGLFEVRINESFLIGETNGNRIDIDPQADRSRLAPALALFGRSFQRVTAYKTGRLEIRFSDQSSVVIPPHEEHEAWELVGPEGLHLVSLPGGDLAVWGPSKDDSKA